MRRVLKELNRLFAFRPPFDCKDDKFNRHRRLGKPCMYYDIHRCLGPCVPDLVGREEYRATIEAVCRFLEGRTEQIVRALLGTPPDRRPLGGWGGFRNSATVANISPMKPAGRQEQSAIRPPYTAAFNNYVRTELGYKSDLEYYILGGGIGQWNWGVNNGYADTSTSLRSAFGQNPYLKVFVASGYYDMATPYFATEYTVDHMGLDPAVRKNIKLGYYDAGHMMYIDVKSLAQLKRDVTAFIAEAINHRP